MKKFAFLLFALVSFIAFSQESHAQKSVAVYVCGDISTGDADIVSSAALSRLSGNKNYVCYERNNDFINAMYKEQDYQLGGEVPEKEIRKLGAKKGVDYVIVLNVVEKGSETFMSAKLINIETGKIEKTVTSDRKGYGISVLKPLANNCVYRLINKQSK